MIDIVKIVTVDLSPGINIDETPEMKAMVSEYKEGVEKALRELFDNGTFKVDPASGMTLDEVIKSNVDKMAENQFGNLTHFKTLALVKKPKNIYLTDLAHEQSARALLAQGDE